MEFDPDAFLADKPQPAAVATFDPDAFLAEKPQAAAADTFDPDAFLAEKPQAAAEPVFNPDAFLAADSQDASGMDSTVKQETPRELQSPLLNGETSLNSELNAQSEAEAAKWAMPAGGPDPQATEAARMGKGERAFTSFAEQFVPYGMAETDWQGQEARTIGEKVVQAAGSIGGFVGSMVGPAGWSKALGGARYMGILGKIANPKARKIVDAGVRGIATFVARDQLYMPTDAELGDRIDRAGQSALMGAGFAAAGGLAEFGTLGKVAVYPALATLGAAGAEDPLDAAIGAASLVFLHALGQTRDYAEARARTSKTMEDLGVDRGTAERLAKLLAERRAAIAEQENAATARLQDLTRRAKAGDRAAFDELAKERGSGAETTGPVQAAPEARRGEGFVPARMDAQGRPVVPNVPFVEPGGGQGVVLGAEPAPPGTSIIDQNAVVPFKDPEVRTFEVPVADLVVQDMVPQFKRGADPRTGVVRGRELQGKYDRLGTGPVIVWQRNDGILEVVTGRNRYDLAKRTGEKTIPAQIVKEADGYTLEMAQRQDVEANIRDEQGEVSDYAHYFRNYPQLDEGTARTKGLLSRAKGQAGWALGKNATDDLYALFQAGRISEDKAVAIAQTAPQNAALQSAGIEFAKETGVTARDVGNYLGSLVERAKERQAQGAQGDLFGFDDTALKEAKDIAKAASRKQAQIEQKLSVLRAGRKIGKAQFSEMAKQYGIRVDDPEAIAKAMTALYTEADDWGRWATDQEKVRLLRRELGMEKGPEGGVSAVQEAPAGYGAQNGLKQDVLPFTQDRKLEKVPNHSRWSVITEPDGTEHAELDYDPETGKGKASLTTRHNAIGNTEYVIRDSDGNEMAAQLMSANGLPEEAEARVDNKPTVSPEDKARVEAIAKRYRDAGIEVEARRHERMVWTQPPKIKFTNYEGRFDFAGLDRVADTIIASHERRNKAAKTRELVKTLPMKKPEPFGRRPDYTLTLKQYATQEVTGGRDPENLTNAELLYILNDNWTPSTQFDNTAEPLLEASKSRKSLIRAVEDTIEQRMANERKFNNDETAPKQTGPYVRGIKNALQNGIDVSSDIMAEALALKPGFDADIRTPAQIVANRKRAIERIKSEAEVRAETRWDKLSERTKLERDHDGHVKKWIDEDLARKQKTIDSYEKEIREVQARIDAGAQEKVEAIKAKARSVQVGNTAMPEQGAAAVTPIGDLAAGAQGESMLRRTLRLTAESKGGGQASGNVSALATRALQQKARALINAIDEGRLTENQAADRWTAAQVEISRGQKKLENRPAPRAETVDMFAPAGPAPGMLLEGEGEYGLAKDGKTDQSTGIPPGVDHEKASASFIERQQIPKEQRAEATAEAGKWIQISGEPGESYLPGLDSRAEEGPVSEKESVVPAGAKRAHRLTAAERREAVYAARQAWENPTRENWDRAFALNGKTVATVIPALIHQKIPFVDVRGMRVENSSQAAGILWLMKTPIIESFKVLALDHNGAVLEARVVSSGMLDSTLVHPREVFRNLPKGTARIVVGHNHPSGRLNASLEDVRITRQLVQAGDILGISVSDGIITNGGYASMKEQGLVEFPEANPRTSGSLPKAEHRPAPTLDQAGYRQEAWEIIPRTNRERIQAPDLAAEFFDRLSTRMNDGQRHVLLFDTSMAVAAVIRVPETMNVAALFRVIAEQSGEVGIAGFILETKLTPDETAFAREAEKRGEIYGVRMLDAIQWTEDRKSFSSFKDGVTKAAKTQEGLVMEAGGNYVPAQRADSVTEGKNKDLASVAAAGMFEQWYMGMGPLGDPKAPVNNPQHSVLPAELPEAVAMAKDLLGGKYPRVAEVLRGMKGTAAGMARTMQGRNQGEAIELRADLFRMIPTDLMTDLRELAEQYAIDNPSNRETEAVIRERYFQSLVQATVQQLIQERPAAASHVLWHEIGHIVDHVPEGAIHQRGNILGRIASLKAFTKDMLPIEHKDMTRLLTADERKKFRQQAAKSVGPRPKDDADLAGWQEAVKQEYQDILDNEAKTRGLVRKQWILDELEALSMWWRGDTEMSDYTKQPQELYANAFSALLNNPMAVHARAPTFYQAFFAWQDAKPRVKALYDQIQRDIVTGQIQNERAARQMESMMDADATSVRFEEQLRTQTAQEWREILAMTLDRKFAPMYGRIRKNPGAPSVPAAKKAIADWLYHQSSNKLYLERNANEVLRPLMEAGIPRAEFNVYLANQHIVNNRYDIANPQGMDALAAQEALDEQARRLGPEKWAAVQAADEARWKIRNEEVLALPALQTMLSDNQLAILKARRYYSTVAAVKTGQDPIEIMFNSSYGGMIGPRILRQTGYLGDAKSPMLATAQKDVSLISSAHGNEVKRQTVNMLRDIGDPLFRKADFTWDKGLERQVPRIVDNDRVKTLIYLDKGEIQAWYVPAPVHDMIESSTPADSKALIGLIHTGMQAIKGMWTSLNYGFWPFNYIRDSKDFVMNMPGVYSRVFGEHAYRTYYARATEAAKSIVDGRPNDIAKKAMRRNLLIVTRERFAGGEGYEAFDRFMKSYGIDPAVFGHAGTPAGRKSLWKRYLSVGERLEYQFKIAGMLHVDEHPDLAGLPEVEKQRLVQEYAGSPNFLDKGSMNWLADGLMPFYNPAKQGYRRSFNGWRENPWQKAFKVFRYAVLPKLVMAAVTGAGGAYLLGKKRADEYAAMMNSVSDQDRANYDVIPLMWADKTTGKVLYWRGVESEEERLIGGVLSQLMRGQYDPRDLMNYAAGQLPGVNPIPAVAAKNAQFWLGNTNPTDRGSKIVDQTRFDAGKGGLEMAKWTANQLGAGLIVRFNRDNLYDPNPTLIEKILDMPIISNTAGRFLRVSNRGLAQKAQRDFIQPAKERAARMRLEVQNVIDAGQANEDQAQILMMEPGAPEYLRRLQREKMLRTQLDPYTFEMMRGIDNPNKAAAMMETR